MSSCWSPVDESETVLEKVHEESSRVRFNISTTAKGLCQWEITSEFPSVMEAKDNLSKAIDEVRLLIKEKGLTEVCQGGSGIL